MSRLFAAQFENDLWGSGKNYTHGSRFSWVTATQLPAAHADDVQVQFHQLIDTNEPRGWGNQLRNEPGVILQYDRQWQFSFAPAGLEMDATPQAAARLDLLRMPVARGVGANPGAIERYPAGAVDQSQVRQAASPDRRPG